MSTVDELRVLLDAAEDWEQHPHGPEVQGDTKRVAGSAAIELCRGDRDKARTLYKQIMQDCGGYMPVAAAMALIRATSSNLVPDVEAPPL